MANSFDLYIKELELNDPVAVEQIESTEKSLGLCLPASYKEFLKVSNGAEGDIGEDFYLVLWKVEDLEELNEAYGVVEFAEGLLLIGSDGGDTAFGFDKRTSTMNVITVPFMGMSLDEVQVIGKDFVDLLKSLHEGIDI